MNTDTVSRKLREVSRLLDEIAAEIEVIPVEPPKVQMLPAVERETKALPRMRTLPQAVEECREKDPGSCVTLNALRQWVRQGIIPSTRAGKNFLVNMEALERFLEGGGPDGQH